jgi:hypothetical protein
MRWRGCSRTAVPVSISYFYNFIIFPWARLPPNRPEPPVHRERNRRTDHAGHNQKQQAEAEYRIGKVQRTNCGTPHNKQGPCGQADALNVRLEAPLGEVAGGLWAGQHRAETQITSSQYYILAEAICNGTGAPRSDLSGCVRPRDTLSVVQHGRGRPWCLGRSGAFPSAVNGGCDVSPQREGEACEPTCSPIRRAPRRELSTDMAVKGQYAVPAQSWSLRGSGDCASCMSCRPSLKTCSI